MDKGTLHVPVPSSRACMSMLAVMSTTSARAIECALLSVGKENEEGNFLIPINIPIRDYTQGLELPPNSVGGEVRLATRVCVSRPDEDTLLPPAAWSKGHDPSPNGSHTQTRSHLAHNLL
jgi:hypothetical protein